MYQSHRQRYHSYAMSAPPSLRRSQSEEEGGTAALTRSLNQAFYTTSYQSNITKYAGIHGPHSWDFSRFWSSELSYYNCWTQCDQTLRPLQIIFSLWYYHSFLHNAGGRVIKTTGLCIAMQYYALCSCSHFRNVSESSPAAWWHHGMEGYWKLFGRSVNAQNFVLFSRTTQQLFPPRIHADNCIVLINCIMKHRHRRRTRN